MSVDQLRDQTWRTPVRNDALAIAVLGALTIGGAWIFQAWGYQPCDLCLEQRTAYYVGIPLAVVAALVAVRLPRIVAMIFLAALALIFLANMGLAVYHSGVEWKFWQGPTACTGPIDAGPLKAGDLLSQLKSIKVVRCDEVQLRILGLSLANFNVLICAALAAIGAWGVKQAAAR
jgi:disulfide bond formation protein DsbB